MVYIIVWFPVPESHVSFRQCRPKFDACFEKDTIFWQSFIERSALVLKMKRLARSNLVCRPGKSIISSNMLCNNFCSLLTLHLHPFPSLASSLMAYCLERAETASLRRYFTFVPPLPVPSPLSLLMTLIKKRSWKLYRSPNPSK